MVVRTNEGILAEQIEMFKSIKTDKGAKPIRLVELFAGYGSQALALKYLGIPFEHHAISEWAIKSIKAYKDLHFGEDAEDYSASLSDLEIVDFLDGRISSDYQTPMKREQIVRKGASWQRTVYNNMKASHNLGSITKIKGEDLHIVDTDSYNYLLTYSFPCFTADSIVLTSEGYKQITDISVGDMVLTHDNTYKRVTKTFNNGVRDVYSINGMCVDEIKATGNHRFYVREKYRTGHKQIRRFRNPVWKELKSLTSNDYLGVAINQNSIVPEWDGVKSKNELSDYMKNTDFWWLIGRYLADGWQRTQGGIVICCGKSKTTVLEEKLSRLFNYCKVEERTACKYHIPKKELQLFVDQFGKGAKNKKITRTVFDLPCELLECFIDGYMSGDGCVCNGVYKATSISRNLIYGMAQCVAKVYKTPYRVYKTTRRKVCTIEGRKVNQSDTYQLVYKKHICKQDKAFYEDGHIWYPIKSIKKIEPQNVYDIEVEENHSFTVQNTVVHNCQDLSVAGKGLGMGKGSGTRSALIWEVERILREMKELPQYLVMENVPQVVGKKNKSHFDKWLSVLSDLGYTSCWFVINAKDFGIAQNRKRVFCISALNNPFFSILPVGFSLKYRLKHFLEKNVDESYYLKEEIVQSLNIHKARHEAKGNGFGWKPTDGGLCSNN